MSPSKAKQLNQHGQNIPLLARLQSIYKDATFVRDHFQRLNLPVVANERCGSWYVAPDIKSGSVYFKSTDGHKGEWAFSLRRLNLHLLSLIGDNQGCIIVDSCRRGKHMSDALSKTVPIWCCVLNRLLFPDLTQFHNIALDSCFVSEEEAAQIRHRIHGFVVSASALRLDTNALKHALKKPMVPQWLVPGSSGPCEDGNHSDFHTIRLCRASKVQNANTAAIEPEYVQGAGDDAETWSRSLTPEMFWSNSESLLAAVEEDLPELIDRLVRRQTSNSCLIKKTVSNQISAFPQMHLDSSPITADTYKTFTCVIVCASSLSCHIVEAHSKQTIFLKCATGKPGSRDLRFQIKNLPIRIPHMQLDRILICGQEGQDFALGVALALICRYGDEHGAISNHSNQAVIDKAFVKRRLAMIAASIPTASISRTTLNVVHEFLMPRPDSAVKDCVQADKTSNEKKSSIPQKRKADTGPLTDTPAP